MHALSERSERSTRARKGCACESARKPCFGRLDLAAAEEHGDRAVLRTQFLEPLVLCSAAAAAATTASRARVQRDAHSRECTLVRAAAPLRPRAPLARTASPIFFCMSLCFVRAAAMFAASFWVAVCACTVRWVALVSSRWRTTPGAEAATPRGA